MSNQHPFMHFDAIPDYRQQGKVEHKLTDIILLTICAVLSGQDDWKAIHLYGTRWLDFLKRFGDFSHGVPSAITIARVMGMISATRLQKCFIEWMKSCCELTDGEVIAIDGKTVRGSYDDSRGLGAIHMVNAFATENGVCLGQHKVYEKSNEITAIPELLQLLDISGCLVTIDAMGCQKAITQAIVDGKADYVLNLKANHRHLHGEVAAWFQSHTNEHSHTGQGYFEEDARVNNHGRSERRECWLMAVPEHLQRATKHWANLQSIAMVRRQRQEGERSSDETHYYISSLPVEVGAQAIAKAIRSHWAVENSLHWSLDVSFKEDASKVRKDHGPANMACMRRLALTQLKRETSLQKASIQTKRHRAGWDTDYMEKVLGI